LSHCFFASDLHGKRERYEKLFRAIAAERPGAVFLGGDLLPHPMLSKASRTGRSDFVFDYLEPAFQNLRDGLGDAAPVVFLILGNDDARIEEAAVIDAGSRGAWEYVHDRALVWGEFTVFGYAFVPPTPFRLKDWERFDVSRFVDPGCSPPEEGWHTVEIDERELRYGTIFEGLEKLAGKRDLARAIFLFHTPPYRTPLDRAALDGRSVDHVPMDVHVGSIAVRRFVEQRQPLMTLHGHVHESARLTGSWRVEIGRTWCLSAAHDGAELALVRFDPDDPAQATRELL
jgi:Icc-related predicted phosphoesterase